MQCQTLVKQQKKIKKTLLLRTVFLFLKISLYDNDGLAFVILCNSKWYLLAASNDITVSYTESKKWIKEAIGHSNRNLLRTVWVVATKNKLRWYYAGGRSTAVGSDDDGGGGRHNK